MTEAKTLTAYDILGVHPTAPLELVSASYWNLVKELQARRAAEPRMDMLLHHVMRAYETAGDPLRRPEYDRSLGLQEEPLSKRHFKPARRGGIAFISRRSRLKIDADPYEVMGLSPNALPASVHDAYRVMREQYLRLPPESKRRAELLRMLEDSYAVLSDPEKREQYDAEQARIAVPEPEPEEPKKIELPMIEDEPVAEAEITADEPEVADAGESEAAEPDASPAPDVAPDSPLAAAAAEATAATEAATAETRAASEHLKAEARAAENGTHPPRGLGAVGARVLRFANVRGSKGAEKQESRSQAVSRQEAAPKGQRPDVEAVLLGRLAASVEELATSVRELTVTVQDNGEGARAEEPGA